jgi:hypothetical protein
MSAEFSLIAYLIAVFLPDASHHKTVFQQMICQRTVYLTATFLFSSALTL